MYKPESCVCCFGYIFFAKQSKYNTYSISKNASAQVCQFIFIHQRTVHCCSTARHSNLYLNQADADTRDSVTTSVTLHCLCHSVSQGDREKFQQLQHPAGRPPALENLTTNTHSHITPTKVTTGVHMASMHTHICKRLSALTCLLSGLSQTHT